MNFRDPVNLVTAAVAIIVGAGDYTLNWGDYSFAGIALGTLAAILTYQILRRLQPEVRPIGPSPYATTGDALVRPLAGTGDQPPRPLPPAE